MRRAIFLEQLAIVFQRGEQTARQIAGRCAHALGENWDWVPRVAGRYLREFANVPTPRKRQIASFINSDPAFKRAWKRYSRRLKVVEWMVPADSMRPVSVAQAWQVPAIDSTGDLCRWLNLSYEDLEWFADLKGLNPRHPSRKIDHYRYRVLRKETGGVRLIEAPKQRLKELQQKILSGILNHVPLHPAAHAFVKGRSIASCAAQHASRLVVIRMDVKDFFPTFPARRIQAMFRTIGYPEPVADLLGGICTSVTPRYIWKKENLSPPLDLQERQWARDLYCRPHLPQGAPTSPALANICSYRLDCRLAGLALAAGATYTRYADDLAFSGESEFSRNLERFSTHVAGIVLEEGFHVNHRKTRLMRRGVRQQMLGLTVNQHPNVIRSDFDRLKATLTNCVRRGPQSQNRESHADFRLQLQGQISFVRMINPQKAQRLHNLFECIDWR